MAVKEFTEAFRFACSVEFWRMGVLWTISLILSYFRLFAQSLLSRKSKSYARCSPTTEEALKSTAVRKPICIITGVINPLIYFLLVTTLWWHFFVASLLLQFIWNYVCCLIGSLMAGNIWFGCCGSLWSFNGRLLCCSWYLSVSLFLVWITEHILLLTLWIINKQSVALYIIHWGRIPKFKGA